jgi:hypothetical protein
VRGIEETRSSGRSIGFGEKGEYHADIKYWKVLKAMPGVSSVYS